jgi:hypothetical protein
VYGGGEGGKWELEDLFGPGGGAYFRARSGSNRLRLRLRLLLRAREGEGEGEGYRRFWSEDLPPDFSQPFD